MIPLYVPPTYVNTHEWENLKAYWANEKSIEKTLVNFLPYFIYMLMTSFVVCQGATTHSQKC
jgi:hypothetical protein